MPSVSTMPTHQPPQNWATRLLPAKVQKKREKNYEKRALKKIQEDQISNAPRCESLPSVKVSQPKDYIAYAFYGPKFMIIVFRKSPNLRLHVQNQRKRMIPL